MSVSAMVKGTYVYNASPHRVEKLTNVAGFLCFLAIAMWTLSRMPAVGVLLIPTFAYELMTGTAFLLRDRAKARQSGLAARIAAYGGSFLVYGYFQAARLWKPDLLGVNPESAVIGGAVLLWIAGLLLAVYAMWFMRYSFSIEPEARRIVRRGPYRLVRHPIYSGYALQYFAMWLIYPTMTLALGLLAWLGLTLTRIRYEEQVLTSAFPEYQEYRRSTGALLPSRFGKLSIVPRDRSKVATV